MKTWIIGLLTLVFLTGCTPKPKIPADLEAFIQKEYKNQIALIRAQEDVPLKLVNKPELDGLLGWCVAYAVKDDKGELWKYESLFINRDSKWEDVSDYNDGLAKYSLGWIIDTNWCRY